MSDLDMEKIYKQIGQNVKKYREQKGFSQLALSLAIGHKSVGTISMAEIYLNKKHFNIEHLTKISKALDVNICRFFEGIDTL